MRLSEERKSALLLFLIGLDLMLLNYVLIRQMVASFADLETSALLMTLAYFTGVSLGYYRPERVTPRVVRAALPLFLVLQLALASLGPLLAHLLVERLGRAPAYAGAFVATALGSTSLYSVFLHNLIGSDGAGMRRYYTAEVAGSITGIALLVALARAGMVWIQVAYLVAFLAVAALAGVRRIGFAGMTAIAVAFLLTSGRVDRRVYAAIYELSVTDGRRVNVLWSRHSPY